MEDSTIIWVERYVESVYRPTIRMPSYCIGLYASLSKVTKALGLSLDCFRTNVDRYRPTECGYSKPSLVWIVRKNVAYTSVNV